MDYGLLSDIMAVLTIIMVFAGAILMVYLTYRYEKYAHNDPGEAEKYRERRKTILKTYLRVVILVFIVAVVAEILAVYY
jgi:uncharacterized membrane protein